MYTRAHTEREHCAAWAESAGRGGCNADPLGRTNTPSQFFLSGVVEAGEFTVSCSTATLRLPARRSVVAHHAHQREDRYPRSESSHGSEHARRGGTDSWTRWFDRHLAGLGCCCDYLNIRQRHQWWCRRYYVSQYVEHGGTGKSLMRTNGSGFVWQISHVAFGFVHHWSLAISTPECGRERVLMCRERVELCGQEHSPPFSQDVPVLADVRS